MSEKEIKEVEVGDIVDGKKVEKILDWKLYYDTEVMKPCGQGNLVAVCGLDEVLPEYINKPQWVKERTARLFIFESDKNGKVTKNAKGTNG